MPDTITLHMFLFMISFCFLMVSRTESLLRVLSRSACSAAAERVGPENHVSGGRFAAFLTLISQAPHIEAILMIVLTIADGIRHAFSCAREDCARWPDEKLCYRQPIPDGSAGWTTRADPSPRPSPLLKGRGRRIGALLCIPCCGLRRVLTDQKPLKRLQSPPRPGTPG